MAVNIRGPFLMTKHVAPHMMAKKYGKIINIGSGTVARAECRTCSHYVTSKGAVTAFTRCMSRDSGAHGICVNALQRAQGYTLSDTRPAPTPCMSSSPGLAAIPAAGGSSATSTTGGHCWGR